LVDYPAGIPETIGLDFASPYGCSKGAGDQYVHDWARTYGLNTVVFRHSSIYGGRQFATFDQGWVGWFCCKVMEQWEAVTADRAAEPFTIQGNGKQVRDLLHVEDAVQLYWRAFECRREANGAVFNIGGGPGNSFSLLELLNFIPKALQIDWMPVYQRLPPRQSDQRVFIADIRRARESLGWSPRVSREDGVRRMIEWQREVLRQGGALP
jgi:CDP-paratose 2-epimerase